VNCFDKSVLQNEHKGNIFLKVIAFYADVSV